MQRGRLQLLLLVILLFSVFAQRGRLFLSEITLALPGEGPRAVALPYFGSGPVGRGYRFAGTIHWTPPASTILRVIPDDCLLSFAINEQQVSLGRVADLCDYNNGFLLDVGEYLKPRKNPFELELENRDGPPGLRFVFTNDEILTDPLALLRGALALSLIYLFALRLKLSPVVAVLLVLGVALRLYYLRGTPFFLRAHDLLEGGGHYDYIRYILTHLAIPPAHEGWEYHQPPLYYAAAALLQTVFGTTGSLYEPFSLQLVSLMFSVGFLFFALLVYRDTVEHRELRLLASALTIFWPSEVLHSIRIGNDSLVRCLLAAAFYYLLRWHQTDGRKHCFLAAAFLSLAIFTKANATALVPLFVLLFCWKFYWQKERRGQLLGIGSAVIGLVVATSALSFAPKLVSTAAVGSDWLVAGVLKTTHSKLFVGTELRHFLVLDLKAFIEIPYMSPWSDEARRELFWNYFLKTGLLGQFDFEFMFHRQLSIALSVLLLCMLAVLLAGSPFLERRDMTTALPAMLTVFLLVSAVMVFRWKTSVSCNSDFRYSMILIIPCTLLGAQGLAALSRHGRRWMFLFDMRIGWSFVCLSAAFFLLIFQ